MPRKGSRRRKTRTHVNRDAANEAAQGALASKREDKVPRSLVLRRGRTAAEVGELVDDLRHLMLPYTALHFQEDPKNRKLSLAQYAAALALPMGVTHMLSFSQSEDRLNLRLARTPDGPTLSFRVHRFSLNRHIRALQKRPVSYTAALQAHPPIVVTNNFGDGPHVAPHQKLMRITFQNLFPAINVATVKLVECRRVVLFHLMEPDAGEGGPDGSPAPARVEVRHYAVQATPVGVHRRVRRLVQGRRLPNLGKCRDVSEYLEAGGGGFASDAPSDSEPEDGANQQVRLPAAYVGSGNHKAQTSALKLVEIGPRLSLELVKVEKGLGGGDVLYHAFVHKTPEEAAAIKARKQQEQALKEQRRATQQANVDRKRQALEEKRDAKRQRKQQKEEERLERLRQGAAADDDDGDTEASESDASDQEVPVHD